mmetsp:Transcript_27960/g.71441  ORF Transcript_27960/g.71441 Transcript_27960/m.71441 type:complete len:110 (+) Transcript_27960:562-891(+)
MTAHTKCLANPRRASRIALTARRPCTACTSSLSQHRMLAFEKEYCTQRTKCSDEAVWFRYKNTLEANMLHDLTKTCMTIHSDLLNVASTIINNMQHLKTNDGDHMRNMY